MSIFVAPTVHSRHGLFVVRPLSGVFYTPTYEEDDSAADIEFYWHAPDPFNAGEMVIHIHYEGMNEFKLVARDEKDQALLTRVGKSM